MLKGQKVSFVIHDSLLKDFIYGTGVLVLNVFGKLWRIKPDQNPRLSGSDLQLHEIDIRKVA